MGWAQVERRTRPLACNIWAGAPPFLTGSQEAGGPHVLRDAAGGVPQHDGPGKHECRPQQDEREDEGPLAARHVGPRPREEALAFRHSVDAVPREAE